MASKACINRLQKEYKAILREPPPQITAHPSPTNLLEWHYVLEGAKGTEYEGGCYHGKITFPTQYPYKPPSIQMLTPSGRFATATRLCLSMTDFHPESWNPLWSISTILTGLLSFMSDTAQTTGSIETTRADKVRFAGESLAYNLRNPTFRKLFPECAERAERGAQLAQQAQQAEKGREGEAAGSEEGGEEEPAAQEGGAGAAPQRPSAAAAPGQAPQQQQQQQRGGGGEGGEAWGGVMLAGAALVGVAGAAMAVSLLNIDQRPPQ